MKTIRLLLLLLLASIASSGQNFLIYKKADIVPSYIKANPDLKYTTDWDRTSDGIDYVCFKNEYGVQNVYYFDKDDYCCYYRVFYPYSFMGDVTAKLNESYVKVDDDVWFEYSKWADFKWAIYRYSDYFVVGCTIVRFHKISGQ